MVEATGDNTTQRMRIACWITKPTDTHTESLLTYCYSNAKLLHKRACANVHMYIACLVHPLAIAYCVYQFRYKIISTFSDNHD